MPERADFEALYERYLDEVDQAVRKRKFAEGIFGFKGGPKDDPCHDRFAKDLEALLAAYREEEHSPEETRELLEYIYAAPLAHRNNTFAYWMLLAVHNLALDLTERLTPEDAEQMFRRYGVDYPRRERFPAQKKTLDALKRRAR